MNDNNFNTTDDLDTPETDTFDAPVDQYEDADDTVESAEVKTTETEFIDFDLTFESAPGTKHNVSASVDGELIHSDAFNVNSASARKKFADELESIGCDPKQAKADLLGLVEEVEKESNDSDPENEQQETSADLLRTMPEDVRNNALDKLRNADLIELIVDDVHRLGVTGEEHNVLLLYLVGVSRLLDRPANAIVQGSSASGKSYLIEKVSELFPSETKIVASSMTPQALYHMPPGALRNKFVVAGERSRLENDDRAEATRALREMLSGGKLSKLMPEKGPGGAITTKLIEQEGPIAFVESTTLVEIFGEDLNRCLLIHPDESPEQTKRILLSASGQHDANRDAVVLLHHAMQRMLLPLRVKIPFSNKLAKLMPSDKVEARRLFPMLLAIVRASALLRQFQRTDVGDSAIEATEDDYATAFQLLRGPLSEALAGEVSDAVKTYFDWMKAADLPSVFYAGDVLNCDDNPKGESQTYDTIRKLHLAGFINVVESNHRGKHYEINKDPVRSDVLPKPEDLFAAGNPETE